jgi:hypothetical protein
MRVLDVKDRVLVGPRLGQLHVEVQVLVVAAHHVEEAAGVIADFVAQLAQCDELARARGHLRLLAARYIVTNCISRVGSPGWPWRRDRPRARDVTVVIGPSTSTVARNRVRLFR